MKNIKVYVKNKKTNRKVQKRTFELGLKWLSYGKEIVHEDASFLYVNFDANIIRHGIDFKFFKNHPFKELTAEEFLNYNPNKLQDKDLITSWDNDNNSGRVIAFYDAENKCCFGWNGERGGFKYDNYQKLVINELPEPLRSWAIEKRKKLEE